MTLAEVYNNLPQQLKDLVTECIRSVSKSGNINALTKMDWMHILYLSVDKYNVTPCSQWGYYCYTYSKFAEAGDHRNKLPVCTNAYAGTAVSTAVQTGKHSYAQFKDVPVTAQDPYIDITDPEDTIIMRVYKNGTAFNFHSMRAFKLEGIVTFVSSVYGRGVLTNMFLNKFGNDCNWNKSSYKLKPKKVRKIKQVVTRQLPSVESSMKFIEETRLTSTDTLLLRLAIAELRTEHQELAGILEKHFKLNNKEEQQEAAI